MIENPIVYGLAKDCLNQLEDIIASIAPEEDKNGKAVQAFNDLCESLL